MSLPLHAILRSLCDDFRFVNCGIRPTYCRRFVSLLPCNTLATCLVFSYHHGRGWSVCAILDCKANLGMDAESAIGHSFSVRVHTIRLLHKPIPWREEVVEDQSESSRHVDV